MSEATWELVETGFDIRTAKAWEGLFTLGSGYLHTRGSLEEHLHDDPQNTSFLRMPANVTAEKARPNQLKWGTFVPGLFGPHPTLNNEMVNLPWFLDLTPSVAGEKLDMQASAITGYRRRLDLRTACLQRDLTWKTKSGAVLTLCFERFISAARPSLSVQRLTLQADRNTTVEIRAGIDADIRTSGLDHLTSQSFRSERPDTVACTVTTNGGDTVDMAALLTGIPAARVTCGAREGRINGTIQLTAGKTLVVEKRSAVATSRDRTPRPPLVMLQDTARLSFETLKSEHAAIWQDRWERSDVIVEGDDRTQLALRASLYHLLRCHVPGDDRVTIDAKGYAGDAYFGRFFWDTEMYLLPFYLYTDPERARTFCDFRIRTLDGARANARRYGYRGARYGWESDTWGIDGCPNWQYGDHEVHVTADVVYGMVHYARAAETDYLKTRAAETIVETARYWLDRIDRRTDGTPVLLGVMGPNEYTPISNNNAYTNTLVSFALRTAAEVGPQGGASPDECRLFREVADGLPIPRQGELVMQCDGFDQLADPRFKELWTDRTTGFANQVSQERLYRTKCLKQADTLMLMALFPAMFSDAECRTAWDYYLPLTTHDSSLSVGMHALMALRLGLDKEAWAFFQQGLYKDVDVAHGGAAEGIHIAGCGCNWMIIVHGFAGLKTALDSDHLSLQPRLPRALQRIAFPMIWKGTPVHVDLSRHQCVVTNQGRTALSLEINGRTATVAPGQVYTHVLSS